MKKSILVVLSMFFFSFSIFGQGITKLRGTVSDINGVPLPGANVIIKSLKLGTATDINGKYSFIVPKDKALGQEVYISARYVGYKTEKLKVKLMSGKTIVVNFTLKTTALLSKQIVVTAIGTQISREKLGTPVSTVSGEAIVQSGAHDVISGLEGKAAGVYTTETSGDPGAATRIILRGVRSLRGNNQPLVVLDGVPIFSSVVAGGGVGGVSAYSSLNDISPQNIKSVNIYKGPSAAAIWGSRAANGVIVITTKTGSFSPNHKINITLRMNTEYDQLIRQEPLQTSFGQGGNGVYLWNMFLSWGDRIANRSGKPDVLKYPNYPYSQILEKNSKKIYNHANELYRNPVSHEYGITLSGGDQSGNFYLDIDRLDQKGIVLANQNFARTSIRADVSKTYSEKVSLHINAAYINSSTARIQQGSNISGLLLGAYRTPPGFNNQPYLVNYVSPSGTVVPNQQRTFRNGSGSPLRGPGYNNPFFTVYKDPTNINTNRILASSDISYYPFDWLNFTYRAGVDYLGNKYTSILGYGDATSPNHKGQYYNRSFSQYQVNSDLQGRAQYNFSSDYSGSLLLGFHLDNQQYNSVAVTASTFLIPTAPASFGNALSYVPSQGKSTVRNAAMYGQLNLSMYKQLFLSFSGRDESSSTYGVSTSGLYFYPSASIAWQFTKLPIFKKNNILTYGKLRAAIGTAANQPPVYSSLTYYVGNPVIGNGWGPAIGLQYYGGGALISNLMGNSNIGPEKTTETEFGIDLKLLKDRVSLGATYYIDNTTDAILALQLAPSSGFTNVEKNAATLTNKGTELYANIKWLHLGKFSWSTNLNWSANRNKVTSLSGVKNVFLNGFTDPYSAAVLNEPVGVLYGSRWDRQKDSKGNIIPGSKLILNSSGFPKLAATPGIIGDPNPKWRAGITNTFRFKRFSLSVQIDIKQGGQVWNGTRGALSFFGKAGYQNWWTTISAKQATTLKNYDGYTVAEMAQGQDWGVKMTGSAAFRKNSDGSYSFRGYVHNFGGGPVIVDESYFYDGPGSGFTGPAEQFVENGSYVRLRTVALSYLLPLSSFGIQSVRFTLIGRNLALWTKYSGVDPETNLTGPSNGQGLDYFNNPSIKTWIFSLQINY